MPLSSFLFDRIKGGSFAVIAKLLFTVFMSLLSISLRAQTGKSSVGDIIFDARTDDSKFQFCNPNFVLQGYELKKRADESRKWISDQLKQNFVFHPSWKEQTGFVTVRFAVNCFGLTDRFRAIGVTADLRAFDFPSAFTQYLIKLVKEIKWPVENYRQQAVDYYQDVTFKIVKGELKEALL